MSDAQRLLTPEQAATRLGIGRTKTFELIKRGDLASVKVGRARRVPTEALDEFVAELRQSAKVA